MAEERLSRLKRAVAADPDNESLKLALIQARAQIEGAQVYTDLINDHWQWQAASAALKRSAAEFISKSLPSHFEFHGLESFGNSQRRTEIAVFYWQPSGWPFHLIPGGLFDMGSQLRQAESPIHRVEVEPFLMARFPTTRRLWQSIAGSTAPLESLDYPVTELTWVEVQSWMRIAGLGLRLPTEAEWEYACRAGTVSKSFWGNDSNSEYCWHGQNTKQELFSVYKHEQWTNAFGLVDILGHVWEWCQDEWRPDYSGAEKDESVQEDRRVIRGGSTQSPASLCRSAYRIFKRAQSADERVGFRLARSINV